MRRTMISVAAVVVAFGLSSAGFEKVRVLDGGVVMWPFEKELGS